MTTKNPERKGRKVVITKEQLTPDALRLEDPESVCRQQYAFLRTEVKKRGLDGVAYGLSGGLDSAVVAFLCAGFKKVYALFMPEKATPSESWEHVKMVVDKLRPEFKERNLIPALDLLGIYNDLPGHLPQGVQAVVNKAYYEANRIVSRDPFAAGLRGTENKFERNGRANADTKHRLRMLLLQDHATRENLLVVGCANKTEYLAGYFTKFGVDGVADVMPLLPLYKTQVRQLACHLGVPKEIIEKPPSPDLMPGINEDEYILGDYTNADLILLGLEKGLSCREICSQLKVNEKRVKYINGLKERSADKRESPRVPDLMI